MNGKCFEQRIGFRGPPQLMDLVLMTVPLQSGGEIQLRFPAEHAAQVEAWMNENHNTTVGELAAYIQSLTAVRVEVREI